MIGDNPTFSFKDTDNPIKGSTQIDPAVFIDNDCQAYLYCANAIVAKLEPSMIELAKLLRKVDYAQLK